MDEDKSWQTWRLMNAAVVLNAGDAEKAADQVWNLLRMNDPEYAYSRTPQELQDISRQAQDAGEYDISDLCEQLLAESGE